MLYQCYQNNSPEITRRRHRATSTDNRFLNGDYQTGSSIISGYTSDKYVISSAKPAFSRLLSPNNLSRDVDRQPISKMAVAKPEVVLSHVTEDVKTWLQRISLRFRGRSAQITRRRHRATSTDDRFSRWRTWSDIKPEVMLSRVTEVIKTWFQRIRLSFNGTCMLRWYTLQQVLFLKQVFVEVF